MREVSAVGSFDSQISTGVEGRTEGQYLDPSSYNSIILNIFNICNSSIENDSLESVFEHECSKTPEQCHCLADIANNKNEDPYFILNKVRSNNIDRSIIAR